MNTRTKDRLTELAIFKIFLNVIACASSLDLWLYISRHLHNLRMQAIPVGYLSIGLSAQRNVFLALLVSVSSTNTGLADTEAHYVSMGGVGYLAHCTSEGLMLSATHPTTRAFGDRNTLHFKQFQSEKMLLKSDCTVTSNEIGDGSWCAAGGSNAGFSVTFIQDTFGETYNYNRAEFYGQEAYCQSLEQRCSCR